MKHLAIFNIMLKLVTTMQEQKLFKYTHLQQLEDIFSLNLRNFAKIFQSLYDSLLLILLQ